MKICGLCFYFYETKPADSRFFFSQAREEAYSAIFRRCRSHGLVHESFVGCEMFQPSKRFYCARFEKMVDTEGCLNRQIRTESDSCEDCLQGEIVIETMRGVRWSELK